MSDPTAERPDTETRRVRAAQLAESDRLDARELAGLLADGEWRVRKEASRAACLRLDLAEVRAVLVDAVLQPDDVGLRNAAIEALVNVAPERRDLVVASMSEALSRASKTARKFVSAALAGAGEAASPMLLTLAADEDTMTAVAALESIAQTGGPDARRALERALGASDDLRRLTALEGLATSAFEVSASLLVPLLAHPMLGASAARVLARDVRESFLPELVRALEIGAAAPGIAIALSRHVERFPEARPRLRSELSAAGTGVRRELVRLSTSSDDIALRAALHLRLLARDLGALDAVVVFGARGELEPGAEDELRELGRAAALPLSLLAREAARDDAERAWALEAALELADPSDEALSMALRDAALAFLDGADDKLLALGATVLFRVGKPDDAHRLAPIVLRLGREDLRNELARFVSSRGVAFNEVDRRSLPAPRLTHLPDRVVDRVREALASESHEQRSEALRSLETLHDADDVELATIALADEELSVRLAALAALGRARGERAERAALEALRVPLRDEQAVLRASAIQALVPLLERGSAATSPALLDDLRSLVLDASPMVVIESLRALVVLADASLPRALATALAHADVEVQKTALRVLRESPATHHLDDETVRGWLEAAFSSSAWDVRAEAVRSLVRLPASMAIARGLELSRHEEDALVRAAISEVLTALGAPSESAQ